jgi:hypothetical protein
MLRSKLAAWKEFGASDIYPAHAKAAIADAQGAVAELRSSCPRAQNVVIREGKVVPAEVATQSAIDELLRSDKHLIVQLIVGIAGLAGAIALGASSNPLVLASAFGLACLTYLSLSKSLDRSKLKLERQEAKVGFRLSEVHVTATILASAQSLEKELKGVASLALAFIEDVEKNGWKNKD